MCASVRKQELTVEAACIGDKTESSTYVCCNMVLITPDSGYDNDTSFLGKKGIEDVWYERMKEGVYLSLECLDVANSNVFKLSITLKQVLDLPLLRMIWRNNTNVFRPYVASVSSSWGQTRLHTDAILPIVDQGLTVLLDLDHFVSVEKGRA